jgi:hypothetical protein
MKEIKYGLCEESATLISVSHRSRLNPSGHFASWQRYMVALRAHGILMNLIRITSLMAEILRGDGRLNSCILIIWCGSMVANSYAHFKIRGSSFLGASEASEPYGRGLLLQWTLVFPALYRITQETSTADDE